MLGSIHKKGIDIVPTSRPDDLRGPSNRPSSPALNPIQSNVRACIAIFSGRDFI